MTSHHEGDDRERTAEEGPEPLDVRTDLRTTLHGYT